MCPQPTTGLKWQAMFIQSLFGNPALPRSCHKVLSSVCGSPSVCRHVCFSGICLVCCGCQVFTWAMWIPFVILINTICSKGTDEKRNPKNCLDIKKNLARTSYLFFNQHGMIRWGQRAADFIPQFPKNTSERFWDSWFLTFNCSTLLDEHYVCIAYSLWSYFCCF